MQKIDNKEYTEYITNIISNLVKPFNDNLRKSISDIIKDTSIKIDIESSININVISKQIIDEKNMVNSLVYKMNENANIE